MRKRVFGRLGLLVAVGVTTSAIVAAIALAAGSSGPPQGTPPTPNGTPAGTLSLNGGAPITMTSFQWGAGVGVSAGDPPQISAPSLSEFVFTKGYNASSVVLVNALVGKTIFPKATFTATWGSGTSLVYEMTNAIVSGDSVSSGGGQPSESVSLHYTSLKWTFTDA